MDTNATGTTAGPMTNGTLKKRSMRLNGHRTSIALEQEFWDALNKILKARGTSMPRLITEIDASRVKTEDGPSLASAIRVYVLNHKDD